MDNIEYTRQALKEVAGEELSNMMLEMAFHTDMYEEIKSTTREVIDEQIVDSLVRDIKVSKKTELSMFMLDDNEYFDIDGKTIVVRLCGKPIDKKAMYKRLEDEKKTKW